MKDQNDIQLSVCVVTYNQEQYIAECLESLVKQQTNFKFEIIVGEDCSTDNTRAIVQKYVDKYPNLIIPMFYEKNIGALENIKKVYLAARGKYIAHMDGDDMALSDKLQMQFDVLENNSDIQICSHNVFRIDRNSKKMKNHWFYKQGEYSLINLYERLPFFAHSSKMFRNIYDDNFWNELFLDKKTLDIDIHMENFKRGNLIHLEHYLGSYRVDTGISSLGQGFNLILIEGKVRLFEKGAIFFKDDKENLEKFNEYYAKAMLECAYIYGVFYNDSVKFKEFVNKSLLIKNIGGIQNVFMKMSKFPNFFFKILRIRNKVRNK